MDILNAYGHLSIKVQLLYSKKAWALIKIKVLGNNHHDHTYVNMGVKEE